MGQSFKQAGRIIAVHAEEISCGQIQVIRHLLAGKPFNCLLPNVIRCIPDQNCLQSAGQRIQVIAAVAGKHGAPLGKLFLLHEKSYGLMLARASRDDVEQTRGAEFINAPNDTCPDAFLRQDESNIFYQLRVYDIRIGVEAQFTSTLFLGFLKPQFIDIR